MNYDDADDYLLIGESKRGDDRAFDSFVTRHRRKVVGIARSMVNDEEEAYDLAQEAFMRAYRSIRKFRGDCSPVTWLTRIVVNTCVDWQRRQKVRRGVLVLLGRKEDDSPALEDAAVDGAWNADPEGSPTGPFQGDGRELRRGPQLYRPLGAPGRAQLAWGGRGCGNGLPVRT